LIGLDEQGWDCVPLAHRASKALDSDLTHAHSVRGTV
jgi:hypothetical protein